jgi:hypothetical protein
MRRSSASRQSSSGAEPHGTILVHLRRTTGFLTIARAMFRHYPRRPGDTVLAFAIGAAVMIVGGLVAAILGVRAERRSLEDLARPLTAHPAR